MEQRNQMRSDKKQLIYGRHPVIEALEQGQIMEKIWFQQGISGPLEKEVRQRSKALGIPLSIVPKERLDKLVRGNHQGIIGSLPLITYQSLEQLLPFLYEQGEIPLLVITDGVTDVRNFGAIARSAEVCGAHALITTLKGGASVTADGIKTSAGALNRIAVCREKSLVSAIAFLKQSGVQVLVSHLEGEQEVQTLDFGSPTAIVLGSEGEGVSQQVARLADVTFKIPQLGTLNSFNVSVAAGIILYQSMLIRKNNSR